MFEHEVREGVEGAAAVESELDGDDDDGNERENREDGERWAKENGQGGDFFGGFGRWVAVEGSEGVDRMSRGVGRH